MKHYNFFFFIFLMLTCFHHSNATKHKRIKEWRRAAAQGNLGSNKIYKEMQNTSNILFDRQLRDTQDAIQKNAYDDNEIASATRIKKIFKGTTDLGWGFIFGGGGSFLSYKGLQASLQIEDQRTKFAGIFWSLAVGICSLGGSYYFVNRGRNRIDNNYSLKNIYERRFAHPANLKSVEDYYREVDKEKGRINNQNRNRTEDLS